MTQNHTTWRKTTNRTSALRSHRGGGQVGRVTIKSWRLGCYTLK